jgi:cytochrome c oxidase subunit 4
MSDASHTHTSARGYTAVWLALLVLTAISYAVAQAHVGALEIPIMLTVAIVKAALVVMIFMHLREQPFAPRMVIVVSALFVILLVALTVADVVTRTTYPAAPQRYEPPPPTAPGIVPPS